MRAILLAPSGAHFEKRVHDILRSATVRLNSGEDPQTVEIDSKRYIGLILEKCVLIPERREARKEKG